MLSPKLARDTSKPVFVFDDAPVKFHYSTIAADDAPVDILGNIVTESIGIVAIMGISGIGIGTGTEGVHHAHHQALDACLRAPLMNPAGSLGPQG